MNNYLVKLITPLVWVLAMQPFSNVMAETVDDFGIWGAIQGQGSFTHAHAESSKWQWWMEGQAYWFDNVNNLGQSIIRPGVGHKLSDQVSVWLGYAWVRTLPEGKDYTDEHRIWQQFSWNKPYSWGNLATRTRLEQRFLNTGDDTGWRFRQFLKYTHPLFTERVYLSLWDEVFVNFNDTDWGANSGFGQNRLFAGFGVFIDAKKHYRFELRGVAIFAKACFGHPSPSKRQKLNATANAFGAPDVLRTCHFATTIVNSALAS